MRREGLGVQHAWVLCWSPWVLSIEIAGLSRWMLRRQPFSCLLGAAAISQLLCQLIPPLTAASCPLSRLAHSLQQHLSEQALFLLRIVLQSFHSCFPAQSLSSLNSVRLVFPFLPLCFFCPVSCLWCKGNAFTHCPPSSRHRFPISPLAYSQSPRLSRRSSAGDPAIILEAMLWSAADLSH